MLPLLITIDRDACIGSGICCAVEPGVFVIDVVGLSTVIDPGGGSEERIIRAARQCPTGAIAVFREGETLV